MRTLASKAVLAVAFSTAIATVVACSGPIDPSTTSTPAAQAAGNLGDDACSTAPGSGTAVGSVSGVGLDVVSVVALAPDAFAYDFPIYLSDVPIGCDRFGGGGQPLRDDGTETTLSLFPGPGVGAWTVDGSGSRPAGFEKSDSVARAFVVNTGGVAGTMTITSMTACEVVGTYDVTFHAGGSLKGTFRAPFCPAPDAGPTVEDSGAARSN